MSRTCRILSLLTLSIIAALAAATGGANAASPGFQPRLDTSNYGVADASDGFDVEFEADGSLDMFGGSRPSSGRAYLAHRDRSGTQLASFPTFPVDLNGDEHDGRSNDIAFDHAGNGVAVWWATSCPRAGGGTSPACIMASTRPLGGSWSVPVAIDHVAGSDLSATAYGLGVAIDGGRAVVAYESSDNATVATRALVTSGDMQGNWTDSIDISGDPTKQSAESLQDMAVDPDGGIWVVMTDSTGAELWVRRFDTAAATWSQPDRVDDLDPHVPGSRAFALAFGGAGDGLAVWRAGQDAPSLYAATCVVATATCTSDPTPLVSNTYVTSPKVAIDSQGRAVVAWGQHVGSGVYTLQSREAELQGGTLVWGSAQSVETPARVGGVGNGGGSRYERFDLAFTARDEAVIAWRWDRDLGDGTTEADVRATTGSVVNGSWSWASPTTLAPAAVAQYSPQNSLRPFVRVDDGGDAVVAWCDGCETTISEYHPAIVPFDVTGPELQIVVPPLATTGQAVSFAATATDTFSAVPDGAIEWSLSGPGGTFVAHGRAASMTFDQPGTWTVLATASDGAGNSQSRAAIIEVSGAATGGGSTGGGTTGGGSTGGGTTGGGTTGGGTQQGGGDPVTKPTFQLTDTTSRDKVPNVVGLNASTARDRFDRAGIEADFEVRMINRAKAPKGIGIGEVIAQKPAAGTMVTTAIRDAEPVRLDVYAGPAVGKPTTAGCNVARVSAATKGLDLDLAKLVLRSMKCAYQVDVNPSSKGDDATVTGAKATKGIIHVGVSIPRKPTNNDLFVNVRENPTAISMERNTWTLTAGQPNSVTIQVVDRAFRLAVNANVYLDLSAVGAARNAQGHTDGKGETPMVITPQHAGTIDILVELPGADGQSLWGVGQLVVADRSTAKAGTKLATIAGRVFQKNAYGSWTYVPGGSLPAGKQRGRFLGFDGLLSAMQQLVAPLGDAIRNAFAAKPVNPEQTLNSAFGATKVSPAQLALMSPLISGNVGLGTVRSAQVVAAGGGNVVAAGGGNVIAAGGDNVVAPGGANVVASGGGNVIAAGGGNLLNAAAPGVIAPGGGNVIAAGGGNVIAAGGGNVIAAGGGNVIAAGGGN